MAPNTNATLFNVLAAGGTALMSHLAFNAGDEQARFVGAALATLFTMGVAGGAIEMFRNQSPQIQALNLSA